MAFLGDLGPATAGEIDTYSCNFSARLSAGELVVSVSAAMQLWPWSPVADPNAANLVLGRAFVTGSIATAFCGGLGTSGFQPGAVYSLVFTAVTSLARTLIGGGNVSTQSFVAPVSSGGGPVAPLTEFAVTSNTTPIVPGTYYLQAENLTFSLPASSIGGDIVLVDMTGAPNMTRGGPAPLNMPAGMVWTAPYFEQRFTWSAKYSGWVMI
jgi:hypothetical protein